MSRNSPKPVSTKFRRTWLSFESLEDRVVPDKSLPGNPLTWPSAPTTGQSLENRNSVYNVTTKYEQNRGSAIEEIIADDARRQAQRGEAKNAPRSF